MSNLTLNVENAQYAGYHSFLDESEASYGSFEVFHTDDGWFWQAGFPGCLADSDDPFGPYETSREAFDDAQDF
jgi:hypothetical protein